MGVNRNRFLRKLKHGYQKALAQIPVDTGTLKSSFQLGFKGRKWYIYFQDKLNPKSNKSTILYMNYLYKTANKYWIQRLQDTIINEVRDYYKEVKR